MRIISGDARGRKLFAPAGEETRPTADRIRESLFNIIGTRVFDAQVLDLFGGTGAMALEALSRGAAHAVIVDVAREAIQAIERNAQGVLKDDLPRRARIIRSDYRTAIGTLGGMAFDVVFLDPPRAGSTPEFIAALAKMAPKKAVYVSCDPTTLARDLALFAAKGYKARAIQPVDMFPHTEHIEVVCLLSKL